MKCVCICCFDHYETRMKNVVEHYQKKGMEVTYLISDFQHYAKKRYRVSYRDTKQLHVPTYRRNMSISRLFSHHVFSGEVYKQLCEIRPDVIFCQFPPNSLVRDVVKYKRKYGAQLILDCYDMWPESFPYEKYEKLLSLPFGLWRNLRDKYISGADKLICVSQNMEDRWNKTYPEIKTAVLRPGIASDGLPEYEQLQDGSLVFCYLGMINHIIDTDLGVRLLTMLRQYRKVTLHLIGEGEKKDNFVQSLRDAGVEVIEHGVVFDVERKRSIFAQCNFGLNIPRAEIQSSMPLKAIEYMCVGLPFLNNGVADIRSIVAETGVGINIEEDRLQETVDQILAMDQTKLEQMHKNCVNYYNERFVEQSLDEVLDIS